jgi:HK97 family phage major capsid protein
MGYIEDATRAHGRAKEILDRANGAARELTEAERSDVAQAMSDYQAAMTAGAVADAGAELAELSQPQPRKAAGATSGPTVTAARPIQVGRPAGGRFDFGAMFEPSISASWSNAGFADMQDFLRAAVGPLHDHRLAAVQASFTSGDGGVYIPEAINAGLMNSIVPQTVMVQRTTSFGIDVPTGSVTVPVWDTFDESTGDYAGFASSWTAEGATISEDEPVVGHMEFRPHKLATRTKLTNELLQDALPIFETQFRRHLELHVARRLDYTLVNGTGAGQPLGILNAPATIAVDKESMQTADTIVYENVINMLARLHPSCFEGAVWLAHPSTLPALMKMFAVDSGTTTATHIMVQQADGSFRMLGRPLLFTEQLPILGDKGDLILADLSRYLIGYRLRTTIETSRDAGFSDDTTHIRMRTRLDGMPAWSKAFTPQAGSTLSCFVTLAERA